MSCRRNFNNKNVLVGTVLLCWIFPIGYHAETCPTERFYVRDSNRTLSLTWREAVSDKNRLHVSFRHRCLDKYKHYVTRTCEEHGWVPEKNKISCSNLIDEYKIRTQCPPNYSTISSVLDEIRMCFRITPAQPWTNDCLSSGSSLTLTELNITERILLLKKFVGINSPVADKSISHEINGISSAATLSIWLPAKQLWLNKSMNPIISVNGRNSDSFIIENSIQWTLAGIHGLQVPFRDIIIDTDIEMEHLDGCLLTQWQSLMEISQVLTKCNNKFPMICLYNLRESTMLPLSCPPGYKTTRYAALQNICLKIHRFPMPYLPSILNDNFVKENVCDNVFTIDSGSTLHIFNELASAENLTESDRCLFKIVPNQVIVSVDDWIRMDMNQIDFVNWSFNVSIPYHTSEKHILVTQSNGEWVWERSAVTCAICYIQNEILMPSIELYHNEKNKLMVRIEKEQFLWRDDESDGFSCFAFVYSINEFVKISVTYQHTDEFGKNFQLTTKGEGRYWCTGLQIRSFNVIETDILYMERSIQFAILVIRPTSMLSVRSIVNAFRQFISAFINPQHLYIDNVSLNFTSPEVLLFHVDMLIKSDDFRNFEDNRLNVSDTILAVYYVQQKLNEIRLSSSDRSPFNILSLNSTMFCLPKSISELSNINWAGARLGQYITSLEFCLLGTGLPVTKRCIGDNLFGGVWMESHEIFECKNDLQSKVTYNLHNLTNSYLTSENVSHVLNEMVDIVLDSDYSYLIAADAFYVSQIMKDIANYIPTHPLDGDDVLEVLRLYDRLMMVNETITRSAASLNTTNVLLNTLDTILTTVVFSESETYDSGVTSVLQPRLSTFIFYPLLTDITGVAILNTSNATVNEWTEYVIQYLYQNESVSDILAIPNLIIASYIPASLLSSLYDPNVPIIMTLFNNDILFQTNVHTVSYNRYFHSSGNIISVIMPHVHETLLHKLPIFITPHNDDSNENVCGYWNYTNMVDGWSMNGCALAKQSSTSSTILCECTHLTHFAYLFHGHSSLERNHIKKLNLITLIGCSLSLAGVFGIYLSALLFPSWRKMCSTKFLLQFSAAIAFEMIMILFVNTEANSMILILADKIMGCIALGALLHYSVLVTFFWMFIIAYMQFMRYVVVFHKLKTNHFFLKSSLFGWGIPVFPIILVLLIDPMSYVPNLDTYQYKICYPTGYALYFAVMTPIVLITFANLIIFFLVVKSLTMDTDLVRRRRNKSDVWSQLRLSIFLFFLLGLSWIFAFLSATTTLLVFSYLFCVTATLQGFMLFIYFIVLDPVARKLWIVLFTKICCKKTKLPQ